MRRKEDILYVNMLKPDYIGYVFAESKRRVTKTEAREMNRLRNPGIRSVGVFVNQPPEEIQEITEFAELDAIQLHGEETNETIAQLRKRLPETMIWKAVRVWNEESVIAAKLYDADLLLLDSFSGKGHGGTGKAADWLLIETCRERLDRPFFLAGGLKAENIEYAIKCVDPFGIDLSSGIETDGFKDFDKMQQVLEIIRRI